MGARHYDESMDAALSLLEVTQLVRRLHETDLAYLFAHALVQDTAYTSLLKSDRKRLHLLIGETIEQTYPDALDENAALLTTHYSQAGADTKILKYATLAGDAAAHLFANAEAIKHYTTALEAARRLDSSRETIIALVTKLGRMYELGSENERALETYALLFKLAQARNDPACELAGLMLEATLRATPTSVFDAQEGQHLLDRALVLARELNDGAAQARILWNLLLLNGFMGNHRAAIEYGEQSLALARALNLKTQLAYTLNDLGNYGYFASQEIEKSRAVMHQARALWRELDIVPMLTDNLNNSGIFEFMHGDYAKAKRLVDEGLELSQRTENMWGQGHARMLRGWVAYENGDYGAALQELESADALERAIGSGMQILVGTNLAVLYAELGEVQAGLDVMQLAAGEIKIIFYRAPSKAALAYLTWLNGDTERANALLAQALPRTVDHPQLALLANIVAEGEIGLGQAQAKHVAARLQEWSQRLRAIDLYNLVPDAELYLGRALCALEQYDEARAAFQRAEAEALRLGSRRALRHIYRHWSLLELECRNPARADALQNEADLIYTAIVATLPEEFHARLRR